MKYSWFLCASLLFFSCKKEVNKFYDTIGSGDTSFKGIFEEFWTNMNINYVYWDIDTTNWEYMYKKYKPVFDKLDLQKTEDLKKAVTCFREMTAGLTDGHYYVTFKPAAIRDSVIYPSYERKKKATGFHNPYPYFPVVTSYLDAGYSTGSDAVAGQPALWVVAGTIRNKALYFSCSHFSLLQAYYAENGNTAKNTIQYLFDVLQHIPSHINGMIIDIRGNGGGELSDLNFLAGRLIDTTLHFGYTRYKSGNGRLDYTPWIPSYIHPQTTGKSLNKPAIILVDNFTASLSELFTIAIMQLPNTLVLGERTWGATGPVTLPEVYNDGQFTVGNFMSVQTSSAMFKSTDNTIYEGTGIEPAVRVAFNRQMLDAGRDLQLEKAISLIP